MRPDPSLPPHQQWLAFAKDDFWEKLPQEVQVQCHEYMTRLLIAAMSHDQQERNRQDERKDPR